MRRIAVAVLLILFLLSSALPSMASPLDQLSSSAPIASENPGIDTGSALYDHFAQSLTIGTAPLNHLVADLNNDSRPDIAVIYQNSPTLDILFGDSSNQYSYLNSNTVTFANPITAMTVGDMDNDTDNDLILTLNVTSSNVVILYQTAGDFSVGNSTIFSTNLRPHGVVVADLDGDGYLDIVTLFSRDSSPYNPGFRVHFYFDGYGLGGIQNDDIGNSLLNMQMPRLFTAGDFNADGRTDLIIGDHDVGRVVGFLNGNVNGLDWKNYYYFNLSGPTSIVLQQLDGTGVQELVVGADLAQRVQIRRFSGSAFSLYTEILNEPGIKSLAFMDRNADGRLDLVRASAKYHNLTVFTASSTLTYSYSSSISFPVPLNPNYVLVADMNPTDQLDSIVLISGNSSGPGLLTIYYQNPTTISNANDNQLVKEVQPDIVAMGDFNGDGGNEIAVYDAAQNIVRFLKEGNPNLHQRLAPDNVTAMTAQDLDGDGDDDLVMAVADPSGLSIWFGDASFMTGGGTVSSITSGLAQAYDVAAGDLNNDGLIDLALSGEGGIDVFWASATGSRFDGGRHQLVSLPGSVMASISVGNYDSHVDPLADIAVVNQTSARVEVYYQQTGATKFLPGSKQLLGVLPGIAKVGTADLNGDGSDDILASNIEGVSLYLQSSTFAHGFSDSQDVYALSTNDDLLDFSSGDLDDDGSMELAVITTGSFAMAYRFVSLAFQSITVQTTGSSPLLVLVGDADGDMKDDLVAYSIPSRCVSFYYQNNFAPVAAGTVEGAGHLEGVPVWFNAYNSTDNYSDRNRLTYAWNFDDGSFGSGERLSHVFQNNSVYNVVLTVSDPLLAWDEVVIPVTVGDQGPTADFTFPSSPSPMEGVAVQFQDLSITPSDPIVSWNWSFGDDQWSNLTGDGAAQHIYGRNGTFTMTLTVIDKDGSQNSTSRSITVLDSSPTADFSASSYSPIEGQAVTFSDLSVPAADSIESWSWDLGDGV